MKNLKLILLMPIVLLSFSGCFGIDEEFRGTRNFVLSNIEGNYSKDVEFGIGKVSLYLVNKFVDFSEDDEVAEAALKEISKVQISVHNNLDGSCKFKDISFLKKLDLKLKEQGWKATIRSKKQNEFSLILMREQNDKQNMLILSVDNNELALVEVEGNLYRLINEAVKERNLNMHYASN